MKKRLKGLACWWLVLVMLVSTLATPAMALPSNSIYIYAGTEPLKANDELLSYIQTAVYEGTQLSSLITDTPEGATLTGWNLWEFDNINSGYVIIEKLLTNDADWTLSANDVENYANGDYYAFEPIYSGKIAIYTDADEVAVDEFVGDYQVVSATTGVPVSEQASVIDVIDSSKTLEGWDIWSAGWSGYHSGTVWNERISEESADYTLSSKYFVTSDDMKYYLIPVYSAAPPHKHPICGDAECASHGDDVTFEPWTATDSLPTSGNYYLTSDVTLSAIYEPSGTVNLCLNGYKISSTRNSNVVYVDSGKTLNICDCIGNGKITSDHSAATINVKGTASLHSGTVENKNSNGYPGISLDSGSLTVTGGTVTSSKISSDGIGIGVYAGTLTLSGAPTISGTAADINLKGNGNAVITVDGSLSNTTPYKVRLTYYDELPYTIVTANATDYSDRFEAVNSNYGLYYDTTSQCVKLAKVENIPVIHSHCVCGDDGCSGDGHDSSQVWIATNELPNSSGHYYLTANVEINSTWKPANGTFLCLNGHKITMTDSGDVIEAKNFTLTNCQTTQGEITHSSGAIGDGVKVNSNGTFDMYGGSITGNNNSANAGGVKVYYGTFNMYGGSITNNTVPSDYNGGGVYIDSSSSFNMYGGIISGNTAPSGGGVYVRNNATFNMYGGTISSNTATLDGGGVYVLETTSVFNISGSPVITGNTVSGKANNVYLPSGRVITVNQVLEAGTNIGVKMAVPGVFAKPDDTNVKSLAEYVNLFTSDDSNYKPAVDGTDLSLVSALVAVTGVTLDKNSINLYLGKTDNATLTASVEPDNATNKAVTWTTDDMAVATVDQNGVVTAVGKGYTKITATAADGSGVSDSLYVYVNDKIESVVINVVAPVVGNTINGNNFSVDASQPYYIHRTSWNETLNNDDTNVTVEAGQNYKMKVVLAGNYGYFDDNTTASIKVGDDIIKEGVVLTAGATPSTCSVEYIFNIPALKYTVTFNSNGGSGTMANQTIEVGTETALSPTSFTRSGYKFSGWATSADGAKVYDDKQSVTDIAAAGESITLFAVWTEKATITISDVQQQYDYSGEPIEFNLNSPLTGFTVKYRVKDTTTWSDSIPTEVNIYDVEITRAEDADYKKYEMTFFGKLVINKALQSAPAAPAVVNETIKNKKDGKITGVTSDMEYKKQGDADYTEISGTSLEGLEADTYLVRYKETETHSAGADKELVIADGKTISAAFDMGGHGTSVDPQSGKAYGDTVTEPAAPADNEWKFIGWYKENTFTDEWDFANDTLSDDTTIYAKWEEKKSVAIDEDAQTYYYDGSEKGFVLSGTDAGLTGFDIQYKIDGTYGSTKPTEFGSYDVKITREYDNEYKAYSKEITRGLVIAQSGTEFTDKQILKDGTPTTTFTYGDTITVKIKPQATGQAAPMMLMSLSAPAKNQMALFYNNGTEDIQISDAAEADSDGYYTMTVNTTENLVMPTNATVSLIAKYVGNNNMADYSETLEITFNKADSSVTAPAPVENLVYNGSEQTLISAATDVVGGTVKYKLEGGEYSTELPQATNAGTYTVYYKVFGDDYHNDTTENSVSVTIAKATANAITSLDIEGWTYGENAKSPTASATFGTPNFTYVGIGETVYTESATSPENAGTYKVIAKVADTANFVGASDEKEFAIAKATPTYTAPVNLKATYGETLVDVTLPDGWSWKDSSLSVGNAGTNEFTAVFTPQDTTNFEVVEINVSVAVGKTIPSYDIPVDIEATYGDTLADVALPDGWSWKDAETSVGNAGEQTFVAVFTPSDTNNYNSVEENITITVAKKEVAEPAVSGSYTYTGNEQTVTLIGVESFMTVSGNKATNAGNYVVTVTLDNNHRWNSTSDGEIAWSIAKAAPVVTAPVAADGLVYNGTAQKLATAGSTTAGILKYSIDNANWIDTIPEETNAANYTVYYKVIGDENYNDVVAQSISVSIAKADSTATPPTANTLTYNTSAQTLVTAGIANGGQMQYSLDGTTWSADIPAGTNANTYTVYYKVVGDANHDDNAGGSVSVTIGKADKTAPEVAGVDETIKSKADGRITGVDDTMEYKKQGDANYIAITADTVENLAAGTYLVRYKETENYFASSDKQIVIADGVMLTIAFNSNEGTSVDSVTCEWNQTITAPAEPTKENFVFAGWYKDAECLELWNFGSTLTEDITLYAKWNDKPVYSVSGKVTDGESGLGGITVTLKQGNTIIATTTTAADGSYSFITEDGLYNIVAKKEENDNSTIKTVKIEVTESANVNDVVFVATDINSELEIKSNTPQIIVGGLDEEAQTVSSSKGNVDVTVKMTVESTEDITGSDDATGQEQRQTEQKEIKKVSGNRYIQFIEINLTQSISGAESTKLEETSGLIEIIIPFEKGNKRNITVYRYHGSVAEKLGAGIGNANADGEYFEVKENHIVVYAKKFSTYAIGYDLPSSGGGGSSVTRYTVKFDTNGDSSVSSATVTKNAKVAEPKTPEKDGYTFGGWYTDKEFAEKYDFESKVTKNFTLYAKWDKHDDEQSSTDTHNCPSLAFDDLDITKWYHFDTDYVIENGIFKGTTETTFEPDSAQTRAMMVTVLYRVEGEPAVNRSIPFADVDMGAYYANSVIWGQQNGIIKGYSETEFGPDDKITREQIAAIMHRYAQYKGIDVSVGENTNILSYDDFDSISEYAIPSMQWACGSGLIKGRTESTLNPLDNATRVEIAAILHRFIEANK